MILIFYLQISTSVIFLVMIDMTSYGLIYVIVKLSASVCAPTDADVLFQMFIFAEFLMLMKVE